jgi:hypothetical protein
VGYKTPTENSRECGGNFWEASAQPALSFYRGCTGSRFVVSPHVGTTKTKVRILPSPLKKLRKRVDKPNRSSIILV